MEKGCSNKINIIIIIFIINDADDISPDHSVC